MKKILLIGLFTYWIICLLPPLARGETMSNDSYSVEKQEIEIQPFRQPTPKPIQKQPEPKPTYSGKNYTVYTDSSSALTFEISHDTINFGKLSTTNPITRLLNLSIKNQGIYQIFEAGNHPLLADNN